MTAADAQQGRGRVAPHSSGNDAWQGSGPGAGVRQGSGPGAGRGNIAWPGTTPTTGTQAGLGGGASSGTSAADAPSWRNPGQLLRSWLQTMSGLTVRGRCFLAGGLTCLVGAVVLGEVDLLRVAILVVALPLVAVAVVARTRYRLASGRVLTPSRVQVGGTATVSVQLDNLSRLPTGVIFVADELPFELGQEQRFVLDRLAPAASHVSTYGVEPAVRGRFPVGPVSLQVSDPFGLVELRRTYTTTDVLLVRPRVIALPSRRVGGDWAGAGETRPRAVAVAGEEDVGTREYRQGDELRRVHWRSTARQGRLMVRREEQPWQSRASLILDNRGYAHAGDGQQSSFEWAVTAAASIGVHLIRSGFGLVLTDADGRQLPPAGDGVPLTEDLLLDGLAVAARSRATGLGAAVAQLRHGAAGTLVVAVLGQLDDAETAEVAGLAHRGVAAEALLLDVPGWLLNAGDEAAATAAEAGMLRTASMLAAAGWRVVRVSPGTGVPEAWSQLGGPGTLGTTGMPAGLLTGAAPDGSSAAGVAPDGPPAAADGHGSWDGLPDGLAQPAGSGFWTRPR